LVINQVNDFVLVTMLWFKYYFLGESCDLICDVSKEFNIVFAHGSAILYTYCYHIHIHGLINVGESEWEGIGSIMLYAQYMSFCC